MTEIIEKLDFKKKNAATTEGAVTSSYPVQIRTGMLMQGKGTGKELKRNKKKSQQQQQLLLEKVDTYGANEEVMVPA